MKKIILIHGWSFKNYTKFGNKDAWDNRKDFVESLATEFEIHKLNLPGFCGALEPANAWDIDDFVTFFENYLHKHNISPDYVLGYSFGAAIAVRWKEKLHKSAKLILVSPAIIRAYTTRKYGLSKLKKYIPKNILKLVRNIYLHYLRNEYYTEATPFLKGTYLNIVKADLTNELFKIHPKDVLIIFGSNDTATPSSLLRDRITNPKLLKRIKIIAEGTHDIANSHISAILCHIKNFTNEI
ncbi:MAG: alpha/beta fold hydrolase [Candidatus Pacearchaeota archaeon]